MERQTPRWLPVGGLLAVVLGLTVGVYVAFRPTPGPRRIMPPEESGPRNGAHARPREPEPEYFPDLPAPELVILASGQTYSYLQPCGCARPQVGGLERRFELLKKLRARGWAVSLADVGDVAAKRNDPSRRLPQQARMQFETAADILKKMDYAAVGLGLTELTLPIDQALGLAFNYQPPYYLAANFIDRDTAYVEQFRAWTLDEPWRRVSGATSGLSVGYVGIIAPTVAEAAKQIDAKLVIDPMEPALANALREMETKKPDVRVLLFQGTRDEAKELAPKYPQFHLILTLDASDEPTALPERLGETMLIATGHKGKNVGLVGFFRGIDGKLGLKYQLVTMTEHFELPDAQTNPAREIVKDYVLRVQRDNLLELWPRSLHPVQLEFPEAKYAGAGTCKECHAKTYAIWEKSGHAQAYDHLAKYGRPTALRQRKDEPALVVGRQFDPECARCHTTGFDFKTGFVTEQQSPHLRGNQCENCHGPASLHVTDPKNVKLSAPLRLSISTVENQCRKCHDGDNDPKFNLDTYWPKIRHGRE